MRILYFLRNNCSVEWYQNFRDEFLPAMKQKQIKYDSNLKQQFSVFCLAFNQMLASKRQFNFWGKPMYGFTKLKALD